MSPQDGSNTQTRITVATIKLISELLGGRNVLALFGAARPSRFETIARIEASGEPAAAIHLAAYAVGAEVPLRARAAQAIGVLFARVKPDEMFLLDQRARLIGWHYDDAHLQIPRLGPDQLAPLRKLGNGAEALLGALSFCGDGHVREKAVRLLGEFDSGLELPFLLIRLNDWVPAIRSIAREAVRARLKPAYAVHFAANIALVYKLLLWRRADHAGVLGWIIEYLRQPDCRVAVAGLFDSPDVKIRRLVFRLLAHPQQAGYAAVVRRALQDRDPTIRFWAMREARLHFLGEEVEAVARQAINDRFARVRAQALYVYAEQLPEEAPPLLKAALMDLAPVVRRIARHYLASIEPVDFRAFYLAQLDMPSVREKSIAVTALGDLGTAADADLLLPYAQADSPRLRVAALHALARLDGDRCVDEFLLALLEGPPSVSKAGACALSGRVALLDLDLLWEEFREQASPSVRDRVLGLLFKATKWDRLYYAISALSHANPQVVAVARAQIELWFADYNSSALQPTDQQQKRLSDAVKRHGDLLSSHLLKRIQFDLA